jgi:hypothetical protein
MMVECPEELLSFINASRPNEAPFTDVKIVNPLIPEVNCTPEDLCLELELKLGDTLSYHMVMYCTTVTNALPAAHHRLRGYGPKVLNRYLFSVLAHMTLSSFVISLMPQEEGLQFQIPLSAYRLTNADPTQPTPKEISHLFELKYLDTISALHPPQDQPTDLPAEIYEWVQFLLPSSLGTWEELVRANPRFSRISEFVKRLQNDKPFVALAQNGPTL